MIKRFIDRFDIDNVLNFIMHLEMVMLLYFACVGSNLISPEVFAQYDLLEAFTFVGVLLFLIVYDSYLQGYYYAEYKYKERDKNEK